MEPAALGWSAALGDYPWLARLQLSGWSEGTSVIVKTQRPADHWRGSDTTIRERAALRLLERVGLRSAPRLVAADEELGFVVLEDLGAGPALEDVLLGADREAAVQAFLAHAAALAEMQAATMGCSDLFYAQLDGTEVDANLDRVCVQVMPFRQRWARLRSLTDARPELPNADKAEPDIGRMLSWLDGAGPLLALSNGDFMPQNSRLGALGVRLLDFEGAAFQHALLDATHLRIPYAAAPAWGRLPSDVVRSGEQTYRTRLAQVCPQVAADHIYEQGMAAATAAWAVNRLTRLARLEERDKPHPLGFSKRGQMLDLLQTAIDSCTGARTLPGLRGWFEGVALKLRRRWPEVPEQQDYYPAFR
ncbi:MAG: hypothetical protein H0T91_06320 [Propionibacteriaceae bacterium]|nr:hypothetical protein [Propionibacteriaceae bacterium]